MQLRAIFPLWCLAWASWFSVAVPAADLPPAVQQVFATLERQIDVNWKDVTLADGLKQLATEHGLTITIDPAAATAGSRKLSLHAANQALGSVLERLADRCALDTRFRNDGVILLVAVPGAQAAPEWVEDPQPVREYELGRYRRLPPPGGWIDPVIALSDSERAALAKPNSALWTTILAAHLDRLEAWHIAHSEPPPGLLDFLKVHPGVRREFWRALDYRFDEAKAACRIFDDLRLADEKRFLANQHLAIALAVVHDSPAAAVSSRYYSLWAVQPAQFGPVLSWREIWDYYTDPKRCERLLFKPSALAWPMLVHIADLDVAQAEIDWAWNQYGSKKSDLQATYSQVPYDYGKLAQSGTRLGSSPYTLENLRKLGGVCVDQAHFASRVAKIMGVPSLKCTGSGRYGGAGHAWSGFLEAKNGKPLLQFTGRYQYDMYYIGTAFDPQTRTEVIDRAVQLMYAGVSGAYESYADARQLARIAESLVAAAPESAQLVAREAVRRNPYVQAAWLALMRSLPPAELEKAWQQQAKAVADYPDAVWESLRIALDRLPAQTPKEQKLRQTLYETAYAAAGAAKRPDIQIQICMAQVGELGAAKQDEVAVKKAFDTVRSHIKEGTLIMPLVKTVVTLANQFSAEDPAFRMHIVKDTFAKLANDFPKQRGKDISPAWVEWQELVKTLR